jgi:hypothetical protein
MIADYNALSARGGEARAGILAGVRGRAAAPDDVRAIDANAWRSGILDVLE